MISHMCARVGVLVCWRTDVFNHRNQSLRKWLVEEHMLGKMGLAHPAVDGYLIDDWYTKYVNSKRGPSPYVTPPNSLRSDWATMCNTASQETSSKWMVRAKALCWLASFLLVFVL